MKKTVLFLASCFAMAVVSAQAPTLTSDNASPKPGDAYISQYVKTANLTDFSGGAAQTWDYTNIADSNAAIGIEAVVPSATPFAGSFPGSNLAVKTLQDSVYIYFNSSSASLSQLGLASQDSTIIKNDIPRVILPYPFTYGSFFTDTITQSLPGLPYLFSGRDTITGDGYGTLLLPGKTYENVLRIRQVENLSFTTDSIGFRIRVSTRIVTYLYYTPGTHAPLFTSAATQSRTVISVSGIPITNESTSTKNYSYLRLYVLPLSFQSFTATVQNKNVAVQWKTAQEVNTDEFAIQRSLNGRDFQTVATLKATGNSAGSSYQYTDEGFAKGSIPPVVYYRILETDKDGRQFLSTVAVVYGNKLIVSTYPNPVINYVRLNTKDAAVADAIALYDANGRLVQQWHNYAVSQPLNLVSLPAGSYFMQITIKGATTRTTLIKQ